MQQKSKDILLYSSALVCTVIGCLFTVLAAVKGVTVFYMFAIAFYGSEILIFVSSFLIPKSKDCPPTLASPTMPANPPAPATNLPKSTNPHTKTVRKLKKDKND
jgi:hypothetical protein